MDDLRQRIDVVEKCMPELEDLGGRGVEMGESGVKRAGIKDKRARISLRELFQVVGD